MQKLFKKYLENKCSPEELKLLLKEFDIEGNEELLRNLITQELETEREISSFTAEELENALLLQKAIESLSPQRQQIFRSIKLDNKSYEEVSRLLGISVSTISDHIVKANKAIREFIFIHNDMAIILFCFLFSMIK